MSNHVTVFLIPFIFITSRIYAQDSSAIAFQSDRPDVTESPFTMRPKSFQFENGVDFVRYNNEDEWELPNIMLRTGITKTTEFRIAVQHGIRRNRQNRQTIGLSDYYLAGVKQKIYSQRGLIPSLAVLLNYAFVDKIKFSKLTTEYDLLITAQNDISKKKNIAYSIGLEKTIYSESLNFLSSVSYSFIVNRSVSIYGEYFNVLNTNHNDLHGADAGILVLCGKKSQLDFLVGYDNQDALFFSLGYSFRLDVK